MKDRLWFLLSVTLLIAVGACSAALGAPAPQPLAPFEAENWSTPANDVDTQVMAVLANQGLKLAAPSSDGVFVRRIYLDMIGALPTPDEVERFLSDKNANKRSKLIESLFDRKEFADYWSMKLADILRVKAEFPINLWPNGVQAYYRWIHNAIETNMHYDDFVRSLLTSSGSNFRTPQVNFYRATSDRSTMGIAKNVALTFMGARIDQWPQDRKTGMAAFFSRISYKSSLEWKEEFVLLNPAPTGLINATYPDGTHVIIAADADPRQVFADWLIKDGNPWFAKNIANRLWAWTMGQGIINQPDDIRPDNPPAAPKLLDYLESELVRSEYDIRHMLRTIFNSRTYQQSSVIDAEQAKPEFARYTVRRLDAEVLIDAFCWLGGDGESYVSATPEPFTYVPAENRTVTLSDGSITSPFLATFGRPTRDTGMSSERDNKTSVTQRLYLLNSKELQGRIDKSPQLTALIAAAKGDRAKLINGTYILLLSRYPTQVEIGVAEKYLQTPGLQTQQGVSDLAWALINSKEFLYRH